MCRNNPLGPPRSYQRDPLKEGEGIDWFLLVFLLGLGVLYWFLLF